MKFGKYLSTMASLTALLIVTSSCADNEPGNKPGETPSDDSADIEYCAANAASWGNYMVQVSNLLSKDATELYNAWKKSYNGGASFAETFRTHSGGDYSSVQNCVEQMIDGCADIANEVGTAKIGDPFNLYVSGDRQRALYAVESWYSWHSREDYANNILSIRNTYYGSLDGEISTNSLSALIAEVNPTLDNKVKDAISNAYSAILTIPQPFRNNINSSESRAAMTACADLDEILSRELKAGIATLDSDKLQEVVDNYVDNVVLPTYKSLMDRNISLHETVRRFKYEPSDEAFAEACSAWLKAREPWERSEAFLFGPVDALGLDPNMDSWPLDQDAIVQILNSGKYDNLDWSDGDSDDAVEAVQSVRGFHTLEFLLFKDGEPRKVNK